MAKKKPSKDQASKKAKKKSAKRAQKNAPASAGNVSPYAIPYGFEQSMSFFQARPSDLDLDDPDDLGFFTNIEGMEMAKEKEMKKALKKAAKQAKKNAKAALTSEAQTPAAMPFIVEDEGKLSCFFRIIDQDLVKVLLREGVIHDPRHMSQLPLSSVVTNVRPDRFFAKLATAPYDANEAKLHVFIAKVKELFEALVAKAAEVKTKGKTTFLELLYCFKQGDHILVKQGGTARHAAIVQRVNLQVGQRGPYAQVAFKFVVFNGSKFQMVEEGLQVMAFEDEAAFADLQIEPLSDEARVELAKRGEIYRSFNSPRSHAQVKGNVVRRSWYGSRYYRGDGRVMIDTRAFQKLDPNYEHFYGSFEDNEDCEEANMKSEINLACCSPYLYGFSFAVKQWCEMLVDQVSPAAYRDDAFERVVLEPSRKRIIQALVCSDLGKFSDIIDGKGGGCIFLLAGPPGVGKTVTAEAIAESQHKPLYVVGAGELGTEAGDVEEKLREVLDVASMWNAVLLIDECDIFLEKRTKDDVKRNALVAVFLRMLEYYPGILFLTTNRVGQLDEAFLSRISIALYYQKLDFETRLKVWKELSRGQMTGKLNLRHLAHFDLNGREIKHCLRIALAIAEFEKRKPTQADIEEIISLGTDFRKAGVIDGDSVPA